MTGHQSLLLTAGSCFIFYYAAVNDFVLSIIPFSFSSFIHWGPRSVPFIKYFHILGPQIKDVKRKKKKGIISCVQLSFQTHLVFFSFLIFLIMDASGRLGHKTLRTLMKKSSLWYLPGARFFSLIFIWAPDIRYQSKTCFLLHFSVLSFIKIIFCIS